MYSDSPTVACLLRQSIVGVALATLGPWMPLARGQVAIFHEGDSVPGVGSITSFRNVAVNGYGSWRVEVDTDNVDTDTDFAILGPTGLILREGQSLNEPSGSLLGSFDSISLSDSGHVSFNHSLDKTAGFLDDTGVYFGDRLVLQEGQRSTAVGLTPTTEYRSFTDTKLNDALRIIFVGIVEDASSPGFVSIIMAVDVDAAGNLLSESVVVREGDILPGLVVPVTEFGTGPHEVALSNAGSVLYCASLDADVSEDVILLDQAVVAPGRRAFSHSGAAVA